MTFRMMQLPIVLLSIAAISLACSQKKPAPFAAEDLSVRDDREAPFNPPERYPAWAFDQPEYQKPAAVPVPAPAARGTDPAHFFTNKRVVMVQQPDGYTPEETPRVAIYYTDDNGFNWKRAGFFGREQSFFALETDKDGDYGVRFVGPGQTPAEHTPADPARMYHVDTVLPEVEINVDPEKAWYEVGDDIRIAWAARDPHLEQYPVRLGMLMDFSAANNDLIELQRDLADEGSIEYRISSETAGHEIVFRAEALDRAGNLGLAYSHALQIQDRDELANSQTPVRHHDDTMARTRTSETKTTKSSNTEMARLEPVESTASSTNVPANSNAKTRVKVVTIDHDRNDQTNVNPTPSGGSAMASGSSSVRKTSAPAVATPMQASGTGAAPKMSHATSTTADRGSESVSSSDEEFVQMLDCEEREKFDATVSPTDNEDDAEPVASNRPTAKGSPVRTVSVDEMWAPLKRAIENYSAKSNAEQNEVPSSKAKTTNAKPSSVATPVTAASKPKPIGHTAIAQPVRRPASNSTSTALSTGNRPVDLTHGSKLVVPMPGTVTDAKMPNDATVHPWRSLGQSSGTPDASTWMLPEQKATVRTAAVESPTATPVFAGVPDEDESPSDGAE